MQVIADIDRQSASVSGFTVERPVMNAVQMLLFLRYSVSNIGETWNTVLVNQGHWKWHQSIDYIQLPICHSTSLNPLCSTADYTDRAGPMSFPHMSYGRHRGDSEHLTVMVMQHVSLNLMQNVLC